MGGEFGGRERVAGLFNALGGQVRGIEQSLCVI